jgi:hypothetical protein
MRPSDIIALFRNTVFDIEEDYLWSDLEAMEYLNDAQAMFCRNVGGLNDASTTAVTQIAYSAEDTWVDLHSSILKIKSVQRSSDYKFIDVLNVENVMGGVAQSQDDYGVRTNVRLDDSIGELRFLVLGMTEGKARLLRRPVDDGTLMLAVERLPLIQVETDTVEDDIIEVRLEHRPHLVLWMAARAYMKQDAETFDKTRSAEFEARFLAYCGQARREKERRQHKTRVVAYGGL